MKLVPGGFNQGWKRAHTTVRSRVASAPAIRPAADEWSTRLAGTLAPPDICDRISDFLARLARNFRPGRVIKHISSDETGSH